MATISPEQFGLGLRVVQIVYEGDEKAVSSLALFAAKHRITLAAALGIPENVQVLVVTPKASG